MTYTAQLRLNGEILWRDEVIRGGRQTALIPTATIPQCGFGQSGLFAWGMAFQLKTDAHR